MTKKIAILMLAFLAVLPVNAAIVKISKDSSSITEDVITKTDYIFAGDTLTFAGRADDLYFFGDFLLFNGETASSLNAVGNKLNINGRVGNNLTAAGQNIKITGSVGGSVFAAGTSVTVSSGAVINGDIFVATGSLEINGRVNGNIYVGSRNLAVSGTVNGNVKAAVKNINILDSGKINGDLLYYSYNGLSQREKSLITGKVSQEQFKDRPHAPPAKALKGIFTVFKLLTLISFISGGLLILLFPSMKVFEKKRSFKRFWLSSLWGLIPLFIYLPVIFILLIFGITAPLAVILALLAFPLFFATKLCGVTMLGQMLFRYFKWEKKQRHLYFLFGCIFYALLSFIPVLNFLSMIFLSSLGWGFIIETLFGIKFTKE